MIPIPNAESSSAANVSSCIFRIIWVLTVFAWFKTIPSLYLVYIFSWSITAAFENWYFFRCYRKLPA